MNGRATMPERAARLRRPLQVAVLCAALVTASRPVAAEAVPYHGFALYTDAALRDAAAHWQSLDPMARRELLTELRQRRIGHLRIRTEHRFGYRLGTDSDRVTVQGSRTVRIDTDETPFGVGFERRHGSPPAAPEPIGGGFQPVYKGPPP